MPFFAKLLMNVLLSVMLILFLIIPLIVLVLALKGLRHSTEGKQNTVYEIKHNTGVLLLQSKDYPQEELEAFSKAVAEMKGAGA